MAYRSALAAALCTLVLITVGCSSERSAADADGKLRVVTYFYPVEWIAQRVGEGVATVSDLTPEGTEPHDLTLDAKRIQKMRDADVVLYLGSDFQPEVQKAVGELPSKVTAKDLLTAPDIDLQPAPDALGDEVLAGHHDPHIWLDPLRVEAMAKATADAFKMVRPQTAPTIESNLQATLAELDQLNGYMAGKLTGCKQATLVTSHAAFGYLARRFGLEQLPIAGISPEEEPDPNTLARIAQLARSRGVTTIYVEEALPPKLADTVAKEIGATTEVLATLEFAPEGAKGAKADYLTAQRDNADKLATGLGCR